MRTVAVLLALVVANLALRSSAGGFLSEREALEAELLRSGDTTVRQQESARQEKELSSLVERFDETLGPRAVRGTLDIASLREHLLEAEHGLELDRLSFDFRPRSSAASATAEQGSRFQVSSRGTFPALLTYLGRLETSGLPLAPEEVRLRRDANGLISLEARWNAVWNVSGELSRSEVARLDAWLTRERHVPFERDLFSEALASVPGSPSPAPDVLPDTGEVADAELAAVSETRPYLPALTGFVLARPELEPDTERRVLAALRFEGEIHLLKVGDGLGDYEVAEVQALESVTLVHGPSGERVVLRLP